MIINDNVVTSPLSLHMILSLLVNGANGTTLNELMSALHHNDTSSLNNEFKVLIPLLNVRLKRPNLSFFLESIFKNINMNMDFRTLKMLSCI